MKKLIHTLFLVTICFVAGRAQTETLSSTPFSIGEVRVIKSAVLDEQRTLNIYLPNSFHADSIYPVIYLLDGSIDEDVLHIVGLVQFFHLMYGMPDFIVVGITNVDRKRDFSFETNLKDLTTKYPTSGGSEKFIEFIAAELQPYIASTYKVSQTKYLIGQSLGGLLATEILLKRPTLFSHYFIVSPSLWWDNESMLKKSKTLLAKQTAWPEYVYVAVGGQEDPIMIREAKAIAEEIQKVNHKGLKLDFNELPNENHATVLHQSINDAFKLLFPFQ